MQEIHVSHPDPVFRYLGPCDQESGEEEQGGDVSRQGSICSVHVGGDGCYQICQHCMADTTHMGTDRQQLSSRLTTTADSNDNMAVKIVEQLLTQTKTFESILS